jgi:alkane 1-monooxygenase
MFIRSLRYCLVYLIPASVGVSFVMDGLWSWFAPLFIFGVLPAIEWMLGSSVSTWIGNDKEEAARSPWFDVVLYSTVFIQIAFVVWFVVLIRYGHFGINDWLGKSVSMGMMCGVFGINVAHELGHRTRLFERQLSKVMLTTSLYMHFYIEHNRGHHKNVATPDDPATARKGEAVYRFWLRSVKGSFLSAWDIVKKERARKKMTEWSFGNEMILYMFIQLALLMIIGITGGMWALGGFVIAAVAGILLLETVNYVEHYGLLRTKVSERRYEDVEPWHSWNSDAIIGRYVLFELTRHSDHHWQPAKHYQLLESMPKAGNLPTGYPGMMLLSLLPPLWFAIMNPRLDKIQRG